jgi:hypothetical protein
MYKYIICGLCIVFIIFTSCLTKKENVITTATVEQNNYSVPVYSNVNLVITLDVIIDREAGYGLHPEYDANLCINGNSIGKLFNGWGYGVGGILSEVESRSKNIKVNEDNNIVIITYRDIIFVLKNNELIISGSGIDTESVSFDNNGSIYYMKEISFSKYTLFKNNIALKENVSKFYSIDNEGKNIAYIRTLENGSMQLFYNDNLYATSRNMIIWPRLAPNGSSLYYFEVQNGSNKSLLFYARGPNIPPVISGPYLKPSGTGTFLFSNNSKYVACYVESFTKGMEGLYIILNDQLLGPYKILLKDFHFTEDSRYFIFTHDSVEERIELK